MASFDVEMNDFKREFQEQASKRTTLKSILGVTLLCVVGFAIGYYYSGSISNVDTPILLEQTKTVDLQA